MYLWYLCCIVTSQLITLHDGTAYNSAEVVWNSEPKNIGTCTHDVQYTLVILSVCVCAVCMTPYMLGFMTNTLEIRMASNGSLIQTINIPDLHLISSKVRESLVGELYDCYSLVWLVFLYFVW